MILSRRSFLSAAAALPTLGGARPADDVEQRIARRDFREIYKEDLPTPCMIVDQEILERNLRTMAGQCRDKGIRLRGHVKVHKSPEIAKRQLALGAIGVTCATIAECELMANAGIGGVLLTRQPASRNNIDRTVALAAASPPLARSSTILWRPTGSSRPPPPGTCNSGLWWTCMRD